jgi:hypothetical protein
MHKGIVQKDEVIDSTPIDSDHAFGKLFKLYC